MAGKYLLTTLGCKVNQYESQQIRETLDALGWCPARPDEDADLVVVNTCAVTASALRKSRQAVRRGHRPGQQPPIVVIGCGVAADRRRFRSLDGVAAALDHDPDPRAALQRFVARQFPPELPSRGHEDSPAIVSRSLPMVKTGDVLNGRIERFAGHQRAFLKIQDGCDAHCTYCIIPQLRPALQFKPEAIAVEEARQLVAAGHKEIVLTGVFLGAYGRDSAIRRRSRSCDAPLARLVEALATIDGLERLRLSSLEPGDLDDRLLDVLATYEACVPHLHLPLQSGSTEVLRRMNRQYTRDEYIRMVDRLRGAVDRPSITTDIIVGFPGESGADFEASLEVARYAEFSKIHAFPFSPREKTAAARWTAQFVPPIVVRKRMQQLAEVERACSLSYRRRFIGCVERVLVEADPTNGASEFVHSARYHAENSVPPNNADNSPPFSAADSARSGAGDKASFAANNPSPKRQRGVGQLPARTSLAAPWRRDAHYNDAHRVMENGGSLRHGRTDRYFEVHFEARPELRAGDLISVRIDRVTPTRTHGTLIA